MIMQCLNISKLTNNFSPLLLSKSILNVAAVLEKKVKCRSKLIDVFINFKQGSRIPPFELLTAARIKKCSEMVGRLEKEFYTRYEGMGNLAKHYKWLID